MLAKWNSYIFHSAVGFLFVMFLGSIAAFICPKQKRKKSIYRQVGKWLKSLLTETVHLKLFYLNFLFFNFVLLHSFHRQTFILYSFFSPCFSSFSLTLFLLFFFFYFLFVWRYFLPDFSGICTRYTRSRLLKLFANCITFKVVSGWFPETIRTSCQVKFYVGIVMKIKIINSISKANRRKVELIENVRVGVTFQN